MAKRLMTIGIALWMASLSAADEQATLKSLLETLRDPNPLYRRSAIRELAKMKSPAKSIVPALAGCLYDESPGIRLAAIEALGGMGADAQPAVSQLLEIVLEGPDAQASAAQEAIVRIGLGKDQAIIEQLTKGTNAGTRRAESLLTRLGNEAAPVLIEMLDASSPAARNQAARILYKTIADMKEVGPEFHPSINRLASAMDDRNPLQADFPALILVKIGEPAVPALIKALEGAQRRRAAETLGKIGPDAKAAVPALLSMLVSQDGPIAKEALEGMGVATKDFVPTLVEILKQGGVGSIHVLSVFSALGPDATPAVPVLVEMLKRGGGESNNALIVLRAIGPDAAPAVPILVEMLKRGGIESIHVASVLGAIGPKAAPAVPALIDNLGDDAIVALGKIGPVAQAALPKLKQVMDGPMSNRSLIAAVSIWQISGDPVAFAKLESALGNSLPQFRALSVEHLARLGYAAKPALPKLLPLLEDSAPIVRAATARALVEVAPKDAMVNQALVKLLRNSNERADVRQAAGESLHRINPSSAARLGYKPQARQ